MSLSARRAWIEISRAANCQQRNHVALRKESVDRNEIGITTINSVSGVALRKESVDRNISTLESYNIITNVALRKESVDRNYYADKDADWVRVSLSARRAWIEISRP